jgi:hypothetical protein
MSDIPEAPAAREPVMIRDEPISMRPEVKPAEVPFQAKTPEMVRPVTPVMPRPAMPPMAHETPGKPLILGIVAIVVLILSTLGAFFYIQNRGLKTQLTTLQSIESNREVPGTPSITPQVTGEQAAATGGAFSEMAKILPVARQESATAQMIMITSEIGIPTSGSMGNSNVGTFQYWFRRGSGVAEYFQVTKDPGKDPVIIKPAFISPDNNIPDLISYYDSKTLGLDTFEANSVAWTKLVSAYAGSKMPISVSAKYLRTQPSAGSVDAVNLWQLSYKFDPASGLTDVVVQLNASTQEVLFTNIPQPSPTQSGTPS